MIIENYPIYKKETKIFLVKLYSAGNLQWAKTIDKLKFYYESPIQQTSDGGYLIIGYTQLEEDDVDILIIKLDPSGNW
mgnify:CR=1 FL=1